MAVPLVAQQISYVEVPPPDRTNFATNNLAFPLPLLAARVWDAPQTNLPGTPATDDLGLAGTNHLYLSAGDLQGTTGTRKARIEGCIPHNYVDGESFKIVLAAKVLDAAAAVSATVDLEFFLNDGTTTASSDLCTTAAQSANTTTLTDYEFTIAPTNLHRGDRFTIVITLAVNDTGGGDACTLAVGNVSMKCNSRG